MGFYGNITNTARTQFQFDKIYPNKYEMETHKSTDGIYAGRFVLIEYDTDIDIEGFNRVWSKLENGKIVLYTSANFESETKLVKGNTYKGQICYTTKEFEEDKPLVLKESVFYKCESSHIEESTDNAEWSVIKGDNNYSINYNIDNEFYGEGRGYDSTVWQKTYVDGIDKYIQIAELNSVVPTFDISADAPTMTPITPHFDINSTNVYYKLHMQPQWGFRVAEANENVSDEKVIWTTTTYNPKTDEIRHEDTEVNGAIYYNKAAFDPQVGSELINKKVEGNNTIKILPDGESGNKYNVHNQAGVTRTAKDIQQLTINLPAIGNMMSDAWDIIHGPKRDNARTDENSSLQGRLDSFKEIKNNQIPVKREADGTLVGSKINNAIAYDAWKQDKLENEDILKDSGNIPNLNNDRDDAWIKTIINTSNLVGGTKNGQNIDQSSNSGISIHHTFHSTADSKTALDKNTGSKSHTSTYKSQYIPEVIEVIGEGDDTTIISTKATNIDTGTNDTIKLYTPYVDAMGHVVGKNIETITLPFGYKTITTTGNSTNTMSDLDTTQDEVSEDGDIAIPGIAITGSSTTANNTQDSLAFEPYNKWIQTKIEDNKISIAHEIHAIPEKERNTNLNDLKDNKIQNTITVQDTAYDVAGHVVENRNHKYILPYGYKTIITNGRAAEDKTKNNDDNIPANVENRTTVANNTQDTVAINSGNYWVRIDIKDDDIALSHSVRDIDKNPNDLSNLNILPPNLSEEDKTKYKNNINIPDWTYDAAGHIRSKKDHYYTLPFGFKTIKTNGRGDDVKENATETPTTTDIVADTTQDELIINSGNKWIRIDTDTSADSITIRHDIHETPHNDKDDQTIDWTKTEEDTTIPTVTYQFDEAGHYISHHIEKYQLPFGYGKIKGDSGSTAASATYDELSFITTDKWLSTFVDKDSVSFSHDFTPVDDTYSTSNKNNDEGNGTNKGIGDTLKLYTPIVDEKGHIVGKNTETVTLPYGYKTFTGDSGSSSANNTQDTMAVTGDNWIQTAASNDKIAFTHIGPVIGTATAENNVTPAFGDTFVIKDHYFDSKGHKFESKEHTVKIPIPSLTNGNGNVVTGLSLVPSTGALSESKANLGTIKLGTYEAGDNSEDVTADITLQQALSRLTNKIANEVTNRTNAINALEVPDSAVDGQYVSAVSEANGKISVSRKDLPVYTLASGSTNGTVAFNGTDVAVKGLGSAAYTSSSNYATAAQGTNADSALELIAELQRTIQSLEARIAVLEAYHPVVEEEEITPTE